MASGSDDCTVRLWDVDRGKCLSTVIGHRGYGEEIGEPGVGWKLSERFATVIKLCHLGQDGLQFASCSYDRTVVIWDASEPSDLKVLRCFKAHGNGILGLAYAGEEKIVTCSGDKSVKIWDLSADPPELKCDIATRGIASDACMVDEETVLIAGGDATIRVYNWQQDKEVKQFYAHDMTLQCCTPFFQHQNDPQNWTEKPIMYQNVTYPQNEEDSKAALEQMRRVLYNALHYSEV
ncbi:F-box/WD repeat-containing protein lin-23 (Abnormal cell lineage protein 23) [Durusdinium trenchii]